MTTPLRPKEIQTRIRAGESPEDVAASAGTTLERIMSLVSPVLAERDYMAERAQKGSLRRSAGETATVARTLGQAVTQQLATFYLGPEVVTWDSYRRPDGRWALTGTYATPERGGVAEFTFDTAGNYVSLENDDAHWLVGESVDTAEIPVHDDLRRARQRRADAAEQPRPAADDEQTAEPGLFAAPGVSDAPEEPTSPSKATDTGGDIADITAERPKHPRRKRASVPSWDEIMFGGGKADHE